MLTESIRAFREKLRDGYVLGPFCKTADPAFLEAAGYAGFDFVIIDLEHGPNTIQTAQNLVRAACIGGVLPIVRVKEDALSVIGEALDIGAGGIQVPQVRTAEEARRVVEQARFAPQGRRGVCRFVRAADYSAMDRFRYFAEANEALVILQLEGTEAIANLPEIAAVPGVDILFIGPYDLSQALGVPGQVDHPEVARRMMEITGFCRKNGIIVGTFTDTPENARKWREAGIRYLSYSVDVGLFLEACRRVVQSVRSPA